MKKVLVFILTLGIFAGIFPNEVRATSLQENEVIAENTIIECPYDSLEKIINLKSGGILVINNTSNPLFWEFESKNSAFDIITSMFGDELEKISTAGNLEELSLTNWEDYFDVFKGLYFDDIGCGGNESINILNQFFTVCENHEINKQARALYNQDNTNILELINYLPYTSPVIDTIPKLPVTRAASFTFNKSAAISYAKKYAVTPNSSYKTYSTDCTNFASQILKAGNAPTSVTWKPYTASWTAAHNFETYWYSRSNKQYATGNFNTLSANLQAGDFIIVDWEKDGRYNHVAFVVASGSKTSSGYYDVTIAQHTKNYCAKVSSSVNGWENTSGTYVRIRF